jgi:hypothetical protein
MANAEPNDTKASAAKTLPKKKYSPPTFTKYGMVREMTNTVGQNKSLDGGSGGLIKTGI